uniref:Uncharacterized protein n=1 Tax=Labrus bergylta TaxID=56723 RepID=A0A3Q3FMC2_9LABR
RGVPGPRKSCTWTEFPFFNNSSLIAQSSAVSNCDVTLLTCLLIGSYRFWSLFILWLTHMTVCQIVIFFLSSALILCSCFTLRCSKVILVLGLEFELCCGC